MILEVFSSLNDSVTLVLGPWLKVAFALCQVTPAMQQCHKLVHSKVVFAGERK